MSNNGSQHLSALTKDEVTAPHVNLVPSELPGDLYTYVANHVWERIDKEVARLPIGVHKACDALILKLSEMKNSIISAPDKSPLRSAYVAELVNYKKENKELITIAAPVFWSKICDMKHRRKIVKR